MWPTEDSSNKREEKTNRKSEKQANQSLKDTTTILALLGLRDLNCMNKRTAPSTALGPQLAAILPPQPPHSLDDHHTLVDDFNWQYLTFVLFLEKCVPKHLV